MTYLYFLMSIGAIVYSYVKKNQVSRKMLWLMFFPVVVSMLAFFGGRKLFPRVELVPAAFNFALVVCLVIAYRICLWCRAATPA